MFQNTLFSVREGFHLAKIAALLQDLKEFLDCSFRLPSDSVVYVGAVKTSIGLAVGCHP